jgi:hypothetical protein
MRKIASPKKEENQKKSQVIEIIDEDGLGKGKRKEKNGMRARGKEGKQRRE